MTCRAVLDIIVVVGATSELGSLQRKFAMGWAPILHFSCIINCIIDLVIWLEIPKTPWQDVHLQKMCQ